MILNKLYKLKKKRGAVLFVVIAMMTLLVIMATAAYYTARGSYATVIRNYDFSQVYMSAISVSDMMIDAVTNDAVEDSTGRNNYTALQKALTSDSFTVGKKITAKSSKITSSMTTAEQILAQTADNPEISGILDAVEVEIVHESKSPAKDLLGADISGLYWSYYRLTTTAYYRGTTISVQDKIIREYGYETSGPKFKSFLTATGKRSDDLDRCVVLDMHTIDGDMYFENSYTVVGKDITNSITDSISATGSVWLNQANVSVTEDYKNWFIGGALILGQNSNVNLGNNSLICQDLVIIDNKSITAQNVYVMGDVYFLGETQGNVSGNLYVGGSVKSVASTDIDKILTDANNNYKALTGFGNLHKHDKRSGSGKFTGSVSTNLGWTPSDADTVILEAGGDAVRVDEAFKARTEKSTYDHYTAKTETMQNEIKIFFDPNDGAYEDGGVKEFPLKTNGVDSTTIKATVTYDASSGYKVNLPYADNGYVLDLDFHSDNNAATQQIEYIIDSGTSNDSKLPIVLKPNYNDGSGGNMYKVTYDKGTEKQTTKEYNAFSWNPDYIDNNGGYTKVYTAENCKGDVILEVGNYVDGANPSLDDSKLVPYTSGVNTANYHTNYKLQVGTYNQLNGDNGIGGEDVQVINNDIKNMYADSARTQLTDSYDNQFMLVSNKVGADAINIKRGQSNFFGYVYAPFTTLTNWTESGSLPVIGGMIISDYATKLVNIAYATPDPKLMEHLGSAFSSDSSAVTKSGPSKWYTRADSTKNLGANFIG